MAIVLSGLAKLDGIYFCNCIVADTGKIISMLISSVINKQCLICQWLASIQRDKSFLKI